MFILFSPSEAKSKESQYPAFDEKSFLFSKLFDKRVVALKKYQDFLRTADENKLSKLSAIKQKNLLESIKKTDIFNDNTTKAVQRYCGVGYKYLKFDSLDKKSQDFIENHMIIFSNLFGPVMAKDKLPFYKLKQGERVDNFSFEKYYKENFSKQLDEFLKDRLIIDLRAGFYDKMYKPKTRYLSFKFLKNSKVVSHWAKAYRGILAREIAIKKPVDEKGLLEIEFPNLKIKEIKEIAKKKELIFDII